MSIAELQDKVYNQIGIAADLVDNLKCKVIMSMRDKRISYKQWFEFESRVWTSMAGSNTHRLFQFKNVVKSRLNDYEQNS